MGFGARVRGVGRSGSRFRAARGLRACRGVRVGRGVPGSGADDLLEGESAGLGGAGPGMGAPARSRSGRFSGGIWAPGFGNVGRALDTGFRRYDEECASLGECGTGRPGQPRRLLKLGGVGNQVSDVAQRPECQVAVVLLGRVRKMRRNSWAVSPKSRCASWSSSAQISSRVTTTCWYSSGSHSGRFSTGCCHLECPAVRLVRIARTRGCVPR